MNTLNYSELIKYSQKMQNNIKKKKLNYEIHETNKSNIEGYSTTSRKEAIFNIKIDIAQFFFRFLLFSAIEFNKLSFGQTKKRVLLDVFFYLFFLLTIGMTTYTQKNTFTQNILKQLLNFLTKAIINFLFTMILIINVSELISWIFMKSPLNNQAITAVDIKAIIEEFPNLAYYILLSIILCFLFVFFPFIKYWIKIPNISLILYNFNYILSFFVHFINTS